MNTRPRPLGNLRLGRDQIFWLVAGLILLVYALFVLDTLRFVATLLALLLAITVHECAHAWSADLLGDPTGRNQGRVSLNPLVHLDPLGSIMMVVTALTGMGIGWGKPVPVATYRLRYGPYVGHGLVSLSGPAANLAVAGVLGLTTRLLMGLGGWALTSGGALLYTLLSTLVWVNIIIAFFNLLPVPPLDGYSVLIGLVSLVGGARASSVIGAMLNLQRYGSLILVGLLILPQIMGRSLLGAAIGGPSAWLYGLLLG